MIFTFAQNVTQITIENIRNFDQPTTMRFGGGMKALLSLIFPTILLVSYGKSWDEQYEEWILDPEPYGGVSALQQIKEAKESGTTEFGLINYNISDLTPLAGLTNLSKLHLSGNNISDLTPLSGLTNLTELWLRRNNISDLTPLAGLMNLTRLSIGNNKMSDSQKAMIEEALPNTKIK